MSRLLGSELPQELVSSLSGNDIVAQRGKVVILLSVDERGWAHPAMFSYFEIVAGSRSVIHLAIGSRSASAANLRTNGRATLIFTDKGSNYYVKAQASLEKESLESVPSEAMFSLGVQQVSEDLEPAAPFLSGPTVLMPEQGEILTFTTNILAELKKAASPAES